MRARRYEIKSVMNLSRGPPLICSHTPSLQISPEHTRTYHTHTNREKEREREGESAYEIKTHTASFTDLDLR
jgi:hypothetical protein